MSETHGEITADVQSAAAIASVSSEAPPHYPARARPRTLTAEGAQVLRLVNVFALTSNLAWNIAAPIIPLYATAQGASPAAVGLVVSLSAFLPLLFGVHGGALVDVYGPARVMQWSAVVYAVASVILLTLPSLASVALAYALMGLGITGLIVGPQALVTAVSPAADLARYIGYYSVWVSAGMVIGPLLGGVLVDQWGYGAAFSVSAVFAVPLVIFARRLPALTSSGGNQAVLLSKVHTLVGPIIRRPGVGPILLVTFIAIFAYTLKQSFYPLYLAGIGFSTTSIGTMLAIHSGASMLVRPMIGAGVMRLGYPILLLGAVLLAAAGIAAVPLFDTFLPLALAASLVGVAQGLTQPLTIGLLAGVVGQELRGLALGLRLSAMRLATVVSPLMFGLAATAWGLPWAFYLAGAALVGSVALLVRPLGRIGSNAAAPINV